MRRKANSFSSFVSSSAWLLLGSHPVAVTPPLLLGSQEGKGCHRIWAESLEKGDAAVERTDLLTVHLMMVDMMVDVIVVVAVMVDVLVMVGWSVGGESRQNHQTQQQQQVRIHQQNRK